MLWYFTQYTVKFYNVKLDYWRFIFKATEFLIRLYSSFVFERMVVILHVGCAILWCTDLAGLAMPVYLPNSYEGSQGVMKWIKEDTVMEVFDQMLGNIVSTYVGKR